VRVVDIADQRQILHILDVCVSYLEIMKSMFAFTHGSLYHSSSSYNFEVNFDSPFFKLDKQTDIWRNYRKDVL